MTHVPARAEPHEVPLWLQLIHAAEMVAAVAEGRSLSDSFRSVPTALMPGVQALTFQALRSLGRARFIREKLARRPPPVAVDALLCLALALAWRANGDPYPEHTLVDQTVEAAKRWRATRGSAPFVNACLRRFLRERTALIDQSERIPVARWNHPQWWIERVVVEHPDHWETILRASQSIAPLTLRVNRRHIDRAVLLERLHAEGVAVRPVGVSGVQVTEPVRFSRLRGLQEGDFSVQDSAAQLAAPLLTDQLGDSATPLILDACAAPGGKTAHLAELRPDAIIHALEIDPSRAQRIGENLTRLGLDAKVSVADASKPASWWDGRPFDGILLDAPCTASGIVRRHPDIPWLRRADDVRNLAAIQKDLLDGLWPLLKPGGTLVYCTCSVFHEEGQGQIEAFLKRNNNARLVDSPGHLLPNSGEPGIETPDNRLGEHDGFYFAVLRKLAT